MKIGLLTYYGDLNCGTNMQALATFQAIKKVYPLDDVEIIPFHGFRARMLPYKTFSPVAGFLVNATPVALLLFLFPNTIS